MNLTEVGRLGHWVDLSKLKEDSVIVDAGACKGEFIQEMRNLVNCKIVAIEPDAESFKSLEEQHFENVELRNNALVGNDEKPFSIFYSYPQKELGNLYGAYPGEREVYTVKTIKLGDLKLRRIDYLKMDIEGAEEEWFKQLHENELADIFQISIEVHARADKDFIKKKLVDNGFVVKEMDRCEIYAYKPAGWKHEYSSVPTISKISESGRKRHPLCEGMRIAIVTRADDTIKEMTDITHPIMRKYAEKIGADFIILNENKGLHHHYRILQLYELFDTYDRIISMDSDVLLTPDCPNLFEVVPEDKIGTVYEDIYSRKYDRRIRMAKAQEKFGELHWIGGYVNSGCMVFSKCHKDLFAPGRELYMDLGYDDVYLGYWIVKLDYKVYNFSLKFNYMHHFDEGGTNRLYAYVIHYAGQGFTGDRMGDLKRDYLYFYGDPPYPQMKNQAIIDEIGEAESVADIGCGEGFLTNWFIKHYPKVYAVDIKDDNRMNLKVLIGDLTEPETFPIQEVEVSVVSEVLEHIRWWKEALDTLTKITTRKIIITVPYGESFFEAGHVNFWDDESVKEFARDGWSLTIKKILTKPEDIKFNQLLYLICLTKK